MRRKFSVGDRVRIVRSPFTGRIGEITTIASALRVVRINGPAAPWFGHIEPDTLVHELAMSGLVPGSPVVAYPPDFLEPVYDGNEKVSWSACEWAPKSLRVAS